MDWTLEMNKMLSAFEDQAMQSLGVMKSAFRSNGMPFESTFKEYFLRESTNRLSETFDRFEMKSKLQDEMLGESSDEVNEMERAIASNESIWKAMESFEVENWSTLFVNNVFLYDIDDASVSIGGEGVETAYASGLAIQINDLDDEVLVMETLEIGPTDEEGAIGNSALSETNPNDIDSDTIVTENTSDAQNTYNGSVATDALHVTDGSTIPQQSIANESYAIHPEASNDSIFAVEVDESNDSVEMVESQNDSTDAADNELNPVNVVLNRLNKPTTGALTQNKSKTMRSNRKNPCKTRMLTTTGTHTDWVSVASKAEKTLPKTLAPTNQNRCTVCGYVSHMGHLKRHMRTHTGEKPFRCDRCGIGFTNAQSLNKHAATHIGDFPFHCRVCFQGFSVKAEAATHEKHCQKRRYECHLCKTFFTCFKSQLIRHMRKHTGVKPFHCEICMTHFCHKYDLKRHVNNFHT